MTESILKNKKTSKLLKIRCAQCGNCCHEPLIELTHHDLHRLAQHSGMPADRLIKLYADTETDCNESDEDWIRLSYGRRKMGLRKRRNGRCIFLLDDMRCGVYEARPMSCRIFPVDILLDEDNRVVGFELSDIVRKKFVNCNHSYGKAISFKDFRRTARQARDESETYWEKVRRWNETTTNGRRKSDFLAFLGFETFA